MTRFGPSNKSNAESRYATCYATDTGLRNYDLSVLTFHILNIYFTSQSKSRVGPDIRFGLYIEESLNHTSFPIFLFSRLSSLLFFNLSLVAKLLYKYCLFVCSSVCPSVRFRGKRDFLGP